MCLMCSNSSQHDKATITSNEKIESSKGTDQNLGMEKGKANDADSTDE